MKTCTVWQGKESLNQELEWILDPEWMHEETFPQGQHLIGPVYISSWKQNSAVIHWCSPFAGKEEASGSDS